MSSVAGKVELARYANAKVRAIVAVCLVVSRTDHVRRRPGDGLDLVVELVQNPIVHSSVVRLVKGCDVAALLLLEPRVGVGDVTDLVTKPSAVAAAHG
jgi:hypothetical protein